MKLWLFQHRQACALALRKLRLAPFSTLLGVLVVGIALALPATGQMLLDNFLLLARNFSAQPQISVFAALNAGKNEIGAIEARLKQHSGIKEVRFVARDAAIARLKEAAGMAEIINSLPENPLPDAFVVLPHGTDTAQLEKLRDEISKWHMVEHVQLDSAWVKRANAILELGHISLALFSGFLGLALIAITFNTIRLQILTQREEIELSRLLGATNAFIRRPFFYFGILQGLLGGGAAWLIVTGITYLLRQPLNELVTFYSFDFSLQGLQPMQTLLLFVAAALLGWIGSWLSVGRFLRNADFT